MRAIIFGTGKIALRLYNRIAADHEVGFFVDNACKEGTEALFLGKPVYPASFLKKKRQDQIIIIASSLYSSEIAQQLQEMGYSLMKEYMLWWMLTQPAFFNPMELYHYCNDSEQFLQTVEALARGRTLTILHGNCQTSIIAKFLESSLDFVCNYYICMVPRVMDEPCSDCYKLLYETKLINKVNIMITQIVSDFYYIPEISTNAIIKLISHKCKVIRIPNLWFAGYFPQHVKISGDPKKDKFIIGDQNIEKMILDGLPSLTILETIKRNDFYSAQRIHQHIQREWDEAERREKYLDVHMLDYLMEHYCKKILFYSCNHPINKVLKELTLRILIQLGIKAAHLQVDERISLKGQDELIYPAVIDVLGLNTSYQDLIYFPNTNVDNDLFYSFDEYVLEYIQWRRMQLGLN